ncbi:Uncharacterised protein [Chromobacterium violaceum]|uniref:Uncharacterized protein n=1 Tax=Chromobacterium violaceum TaxID=536 RepID=A0A447TDI8_CHRVL|nr:Uncharacterised protein [Chromobacterium violaceum]
MVDSGSSSKAEALVSKLREALPPFPPRCRAPRSRRTAP